MAEFNVIVINRLEIASEVTVKAKDADAAQDNVQAMIDKGKFAIIWEKSKDASDEVDFSESESTTEIEECNEA